MSTVIEQHYQDNYDSLVKRFTRRAGTMWDAEDVIQEAYYRALKYFSTFQEGMVFQHWFVRILANVLKDHYNSRIDGTVEFDEDLVEPEYSDYPPHQLRRMFRKEIDDVPNKEHKEILRLYYIYGFKFKEISQIVDMGYKGIDTVIHRFKLSLKEKYN